MCSQSEVLPRADGRKEERPGTPENPTMALMELPINDKELSTIVSALRLGGDAALYQKLTRIKEIRDANPGGPYKKIAREEFGFVI
jgi:hypothetical protein